jgi:hypothetical protein
MAETGTRRLLTISNHHTGHSGTPPTFDGDDPACYHGYFVNEHGEQAVFVYNRSTATARLWQGDAGWEEPCEVKDGRAEGRLLTPAELLWLQAVWQAATGCVAGGG